MATPPVPPKGFSYRLRGSCVEGRAAPPVPKFVQGSSTSSPLQKLQQTWLPNQRSVYQGLSTANGRKGFKVGTLTDSALPSPPLTDFLFADSPPLVPPKPSHFVSKPVSVSAPTTPIGICEPSPVDAVISLQAYLPHRRGLSWNESGYLRRSTANGHNSSIATRHARNASHNSDRTIRPIYITGSEVGRKTLRGASEWSTGSERTVRQIYSAGSEVSKIALDSVPY